MDKQKSVCPLLLQPETYSPDTVDLINDQKERDYWLPCLEKMVQKFVNRASALNPHNPNATDNAQECYKKFHQLVEELMDDPSFSKLQPLSIRTLLDFNEDTLRQHSFDDAWKLQKKEETTIALKELEKRLNYIDSILSFEDRWTEVARGVLAGNMFDWGAKAVTDILEESSNFGLCQAMDTIQKRPWFRDDLDLWIDKLKEKPYKTAVIFVDNAGVDFVLGILPLVRELCKLNTNVILSANSYPALNDITEAEMCNCLKEVSKHCSILGTALASKQLVTMENGQKGPCLDLMNLNSDLCDMMAECDLIILEGMGRAVHTNLNARFKVDSLKLAVLKNEWLANSLGTNQFSIIFEYKPVS